MARRSWRTRVGEPAVGRGQPREPGPLGAGSNGAGLGSTIFPIASLASRTSAEPSTTRRGPTVVGPIVDLVVVGVVVPAGEDHDDVGLEREPLVEQEAEASSEPNAGIPPLMTSNRAGSSLAGRGRRDTWPSSVTPGT